MNETASGDAHSASSDLPALPASFYAELAENDRISRMVDHWRRAVIANHALELENERLRYALARVSDVLYQSGPVVDRARELADAALGHAKPTPDLGRAPSPLDGRGHPNPLCPVHGTDEVLLGCPCNDDDSPPMVGKIGEGELL